MGINLESILTMEMESAEADYGISYDIPPTIDGMLGGFAKISGTDIDGSSKFLKGLFRLDDAPGNARCLDCGAGIGRISKHLLQRHFSTVDLVEQNPKFLEQAKKYLGVDSESGGTKTGQLICSGLQDFTPSDGAYDVIWCQWVLGHLTDEDLVAFFKRAKVGLNPRGLIVVKENVTSTGEVEKDEDDSSVTRPDETLKEIFEQAGLDLVRDLKQQKFPKELYQVKMYALRPR